jgi:hypothetical protein
MAMPDNYRICRHILPDNDRYFFVISSLLKRTTTEQRANKYRTTTEQMSLMVSLSYVVKIKVSCHRFPRMPLTPADN